MVLFILSAAAFMVGAWIGLKLPDVNRRTDLVEISQSP